MPSNVWGEVTYPFPNRFYRRSFGMGKWFHHTRFNGCNNHFGIKVKLNGGLACLSLQFYMLLSKTILYLLILMTMNVCSLIKRHHSKLVEKTTRDIVTMMTLSNGNIFRVMALFEGNPPATGGFPSQRQVTVLWCFLWSAPNIVEQTIETVVILGRHRAHYEVTVMTFWGFVVDLIFVLGPCIWAWRVLTCPWRLSGRPSVRPSVPSSLPLYSPPSLKNPIHIWHSCWQE